MEDLDLQRPVPRTAAPPREVLVIGSVGARLTDWVAERLRPLFDRVTIAIDTAPVFAWPLGGAGSPPLAVLVQERPGDLPHDLPSRLRAQANGIELLSVAGDWCEGELRTGKPWADVERVYWHALPGWLDRWKERRDEEAASRSDSFLVALEAVERETALALSSALAPEGIASVWWPRGRPTPCGAGYGAGLWVGGQLRGREADQLSAFGAAMRGHGAPTVALIDFPRLDEWRLAERLGAVAVLGKPWNDADLFAALRSSGAPAVVGVRRPLPRLRTAA